MSPEMLDWFFKAMMSGLGASAVYVLWELLKSVSSLNLKIAVVVSQVENHGQRLDRLEDR